MTLSGWILLIVSWSMIISVCAACFWRILTSQRENFHAPLDIDTGDLNNPGAPQGPSRPQPQG